MPGERIEVDGAIGEGGGQVLRTALGMSLVTGTPVRVRNIRANRQKPGLRPQHLAAVKAAALVGNEADLEGAAIDSREVVFSPRGLLTGPFRFDVGTAGSGALVLQTVLPALMGAREPSAIILEGGTHNPLAPPFEFLSKAFLPLVERMGPKIVAKLDRVGFYPTGGGKVRVEIQPPKDGKLKKLKLLERGEVIRRRAYACVVELPPHIVERELKLLKQRLKWSPLELRSGDLGRGRDPGNVLWIEIESEHVTEVITALGAKNIRAEQVAEAAAAETQRYLDANVPVGEHLADQLLVPMAAAGGGSFRTLEPSTHTRTQVDVLRLFGVDVSLDEQDDGSWLIKVKA